MAHYVIYGAGAVGGVIGANLWRAGFAVTLVARGAHLEAMRERGGLEVDTAAGPVLARTQLAASAGEVDWSPDSVVLLCVKSHQTAAALDDLEAHAHPRVPVVAAQNGVANESAILRRFERVYGMLVLLPAVHTQPGVVVQDSAAAPGILDIGSFPRGVDATAESISRDLRESSFVSMARPDIMAWKHRKLILNLGNGVGASFIANDAAAELARLCRSEGEAVIEAAGIPMATAAQEEERRGAHIARRPVARGERSSTWQSIARGAGSAEVDYLSGEIVLLGRLHGVPTPANELVRSTTARLARERLPAGSVDATGLIEGLRRGRS